MLGKVNDEIINISILHKYDSNGTFLRVALDGVAFQFYISTILTQSLPLVEVFIV